jgi:hypothetical protein
MFLPRDSNPTLAFIYIIWEILYNACSSPRSHVPHRKDNRNVLMLLLICIHHLPYSCYIPDLGINLEKKTLIIKLLDQFRKVLIIYVQISGRVLIRWDSRTKKDYLIYSWNFFRSRSPPCSSQSKQAKL